MKKPASGMAVFAAGAAMICSVAASTAQELTATEREAILAEIEKIEKSLEGGRAKNNVRVMGQLRDAASSHAKSLSFYLNCVKEEDWDGMGKRASEWKEWRDGEDDFKDSDYAKARQFQIRYMILTIKAAMLEEGDDSGRAKLLSDLTSYISGLVSNYGDVINHADVLQEGALNNLIARSTKLDVSLDKPKGWASTPLSIDSMYEASILPYYREKKNVSSLRKAWESRIIQLSKIKGTVEPVKISTRVKGGVIGSDRRGRGDTADRDKVREERKEKADEAAERLAEFKKDELPRLQWDMERDSFVFGTKRAASVRALGAHVRKHLDHSSASGWISELKKLASGDFSIEDYLDLDDDEKKEPKK